MNTKLSGWRHRLALAVAMTIAIASGFVPVAVVSDKGPRSPASYSMAAFSPLAIVSSPEYSSSAPPFQVARYADEYQTAKMARQWLPEIKRAVDDAVAAGLLTEGERQLWENILLGQVGLESVGQAFIVPNSGSPNYSQGLTQLTYPTLYAEENPFDPLTNLRVVLRTTIRYYRNWGNRWDRALGQYLTGSSDEKLARNSSDWNGTTGETYAERVVNIVWQAATLEQANDRYPPRESALQATCGGETCWYDHAPPWGLWDSPSLAFNWLPPSNDVADQYVLAGADGNVSHPIGTATWVSVPSWFYTMSPAPNVAAYRPRLPTPEESRAYPSGSTTLTGPYREQYPRRIWSLGAP